MMTRNAFSIGLLIAAALAMPASFAGPTTVPATTSSFIELRPGERFFRVDGAPAFVLGRNPVAMNPVGFEDHFARCAAAGERFVRIHFCYGPPGERPGEIDANLLKSWDATLDAAARQGVAVLPVLGIWAQWNDGSNHEHWHTWDRNPYNAALGGPAQSPAELLDDTPCRRLWLRRLATIVRRWSPRANVVGWEVFSELDLLSGADERQAAAFARAAAAVVREADPRHRPVTISLSEGHEWPLLRGCEALDFGEVHPYPGPRGQLDLAILRTVRQRLARYGKPVLIGECGLDAGPPRGTLDAAERAEVGLRHAVWAAVVSGSMAGRMLWWQDGYDQFEQADLCSRYQDLSVPAVAFVRGMDFSGFAPVECEASPGIVGAMLGNDRAMIGWFRDVRCVPPTWPIEVVVGQSVTVAAPAGAWTVQYLDPATGIIIATDTIDHSVGKLNLRPPRFRDAIAFRMSRKK